MKSPRRSTRGLFGRAVGSMVDLMVPSRLHLAWIVVNQTTTPKCYRVGRKFLHRRLLTTEPQI